MIGDKKDPAAVHHCAQFVEKNDKCSLWEVFAEGMKFQSSNWQTTKPEFKEECLLITASKWKHGWEYTSWQIKWTECDGASYMGWFTGENEEYGDLADLNAEMYLVLPLLK